MSRYNKLFKNIFTMTLGSLSSKLLIFLMVPLYTAYLSTEEYGTVDVMFTTINMLYPILSLLAGEISLRFALDKCYDKTKVFSTVLKLHTFGFCIMLLLSPLLKLVPSLYEYYVLFCIYYFCSSLHNVVMQFSKGCNATKEYALSGIISTFVTVSLNIIFLVFLKLKINGYLYAYIIASVISTLYLIIKLKLHKYVNLRHKTDRHLLKEMIKYSLPLVPNSVCWWINNSLDRYVLTFYVGVSAVGIYSAANKIPSLLSVFFTIFINSWQISAVDGYGTEENRAFFSSIYKKCTTILTCASSLLILFTRLISRFLLNEKFWDAGNFSQILIVAFLFHSISAFLGTIYTTSKKTSTIFITTMCGALINLVLNFILIPKYGCHGAAIATAIAYFGIWVCRLAGSRKILNLSVNIGKELLSYALILTEVIVVVSMVKYYNLISAVIIVIIFALNRNEIKNILDFKKIISVIKDRM